MSEGYLEYNWFSTWVVLDKSPQCSNMTFSKIVLGHPYKILRQTFEDGLDFGAGATMGPQKMEQILKQGVKYI